MALEGMLIRTIPPACRAEVIIVLLVSRVLPVFTTTIRTNRTSNIIMQVPINQRPWPRDKRFASVNNFGFGGTNAHVVLERAPFLTKIEPEVDESALHIRKLFVLSANDKPAVEALMQNMGIYLERRPEIFQNDLMSNVAYSLGQRRSL
jgi:acyl transferase domain-containing protein